jgi:hypothetical protein
MASPSVTEAMIFIGSHTYFGYPERIQNRTTQDSRRGHPYQHSRNYAYIHKLYGMADGNRTMLPAWDWVTCTPATGVPTWEREPTPVQMALARGHRWVAMLESGVVKLLPELARRAGCTAAT